MRLVRRPAIQGWCRYVPLLVAMWTIASAGADQRVFVSSLGGSGQDYATCIASDSAGNAYVAGATYSPDFRVTAGAFQTTFNANSAAFVAKFSPSGSLLWSTYLGGTVDSYATGIAVDSAGNVVVTGWTRSPNFPMLNAAQSQLNNGIASYNWDAFLTKLDPTGSKLVYSTFLGGPGDDGAYGLALDAAGNAYVTGQVTEAAGFTGFTGSPVGFGMFVGKFSPAGTLVYSFFQPNVAFGGTAAGAAIAVDSGGAAYVTGTATSIFPLYGFPSDKPGNTKALVFKLSADGTKVVYSRLLGGSAQSNGLAIAVDNDGSAYVGGLTTAVDFPMVHPFQNTLGQRPLWKSADGGNTWAPHDSLPFAFLQQVVVDPSTPSTIYAVTTELGIFKSLDGGVSWSAAYQGIGAAVTSLTIDSLHPQTLYAIAGVAVYRTTSGGDNWSRLDSLPANAGAIQVAVDPRNSNNVYVVGSDGVTRKSSDAGANFSNLPFPGTSIAELVLDPRVSGSVFAYSRGTTSLPPPPSGIPPYIWHSSDGGDTWTRILNATPPPNPPPTNNWMIDGSTNPSTVYDWLSYRSNDGGVTWTALPSSVVDASAGNIVTLDSSGTLYAAVSGKGMYTSHDKGKTWSQIGTPVPASNDSGAPPNILQIAPVGSGGTLFDVVQNQQTSGFLARLSPDGSNLVFSTLLNGHASMSASGVVNGEQGLFATQNWISGMALDRSGNIVVAGGTRAADFPTANPQQSANAGRLDAFVTSFTPYGDRLHYSTYFGGSRDDGALAVAVDGQGNVMLAGQTSSADFPVTAPGEAPAGGGEAFVAKIAPPAPPVITAVLNAASYQPAIESGSWVVIQGTNLARTTRLWQNSDFTGNDLPTSLDGVSVTMDGLPAYVEYISPTQINVVAPGDGMIGAVRVVVSNKGQQSDPVTATYQSYAPALFTSGTSAIASRLTNWATVSVEAPAMPGDLVVLWATGFGPTNPPTRAGTISAAAATVAVPVVSIGGVRVPVVSSMLTSGTAGLYQITVQLPANVPTGTPAVVASIGGTQTQSGVTLFVGKQ